jgi:ABC-type glycerol-3-phosphate transport system substrate-binding protein
MCIKWPAAIASQLEDPDKSRIIGKWVACAPPGPGNIGTEGIYMTKTAKDKEAAWEFLKWFTGKEMTAEVVKYTGIPHSRISLAEDPDVLESVPGIQGAMQANSRSYVWGGSAFPKGGALFVGFSGHMGNYMAGKETAQECLDNGVKVWLEHNGEYIGKIEWFSYFEQQGIPARR